ncbi:hypothetical protein CEXT_657091 [Caerostris extrusa]|uniref:Uncharacterized protein n=1 Tax=Caerostris extrusa TaxID=172846 RepID=A0AAV4MT89_CAEEX|nr:hypothetical protein CEXT_657091 [Caerostris extrusa]
MQAKKLSAEQVPGKSLFLGPGPLSCPSLFDEFHAQLMFAVYGPMRSRKNKHAGISSNIRMFRIMQAPRASLSHCCHDDSETFLSEPVPSQWNLLGVASLRQ